MRVVATVLSLGLFQSVALPAFAAGQPAAVEVEEVTVTAQKRTESLLEVPLSVSAFTDRALDERGASELADFLQTAPGVSIVDSQGGNQTITIRGISSSIGDSTVGYYLDEVSFAVLGNTSVTDVRTFDIERVEVLRGPQGTLYGDGSLGGVIRILTKDPHLNDLEAKADLSSAWTKDSDDISWAAKGALNLPIVQDKLALRIVASSEESAGWADSLLTGEADFNSRQVDTYRVKLRFKPTESLDAVASLWRHEETSSGDSSTLSDRTSSQVVPVMAGDYTVYSLALNYEFAGFNLVSSSAWMNWTNSQVSELFGLPLISNNLQDVFQQEVRLTSPADARFKWTAGLYYREIDREFNGAVIGIDLLQQSDSKAWAVFGEGTWSFLDDRLNATVGLRYFEDERSRQDQPDLLGRVVENFGTTTPRFNLAYDLNDDWMAFVNVTKGFRSGQIQPIASIATGMAFGFDVPIGIEAEALWSYEAGIKGTAFGNRLVVDAAIYQNEWDNLQIGKTVNLPGVPLGYFDNGGRARVRGVELALTARPVEGLVLEGGGSWNRSEFLETLPDANVVAGQVLPNVPKVTLHAAATYRWDLTEGLRGFARAGVQYNSRRFNAPGLAEPSGEITTVDARLGIEAERWGLFLFGENLTDDRSAVSATSPAFLGHAVRLRPRTIGINLRANF